MQIKRTRLRLVAHIQALSRAAYLPDRYKFFDMELSKYETTEEELEALNQKTIKEINEAIGDIQHPRIGRVVPEYNEETLRELIVGNYRLPYRIKEDGIYVEAVWHVRQIPPEKE